MHAAAAISRDHATPLDSSRPGELAASKDALCPKEMVSARREGADQGQHSKQEWVNPLPPPGFTAQLSLNSVFKGQPNREFHRLPEVTALEVELHRDSLPVAPEEGRSMDGDETVTKLVC